MIETKNQRFKRLATLRTNTVLHKLKVLSNCSNRSTYDYTEEEVSKIFAAIDKSVREAKAKFTFTRSKTFKL